MYKLFLLSILVPMISFASGSVDSADFDSLGGNTVLLEKAKMLNPETVTSIVQDRTVSRRNRFEFAPEFSGTFGGDTYNRTKSIGLNIQYHLNPRFSFGIKSNYSFNSLTPEGEAMVNSATANFLANPKDPSVQFPDVDFPKNETMALINWYPIYGKINLLDKSVAHFDVYTLAGAGNVSLQSGSTSLSTLGAGIGFWLSPHLSTRFEMRWQGQKAKYYNGEKNLDLAVAGLQMGWIL